MAETANNIQPNSKSSRTQSNLVPQRRPLKSYTDEELKEMFEQTAEEDIWWAELGLEEYAQHLRDIDEGKAW